MQIKYLRTWLVSLISFILLFVSCATEQKRMVDQPPVSTVVESPAISSRNPFWKKRALQILGKMSLEEKVGQLFIQSYRWNSALKPIRGLTTQMKNDIVCHHLGGIILFGENVGDAAQLGKFIDECQSNASIKLFVAIDEEGGRVSRLANSGLVKVTKFPGNSVLGRIGDTNLAYQQALIIGRELSCLGINFNLAPVADLNTNPHNPVIGDRSFGSDPYLSGRLVNATVRGLRESDVISCLKHFPGHGDTELDTHLGSVVLDRSSDILSNREFIPFRMGIAGGADAVMIAHISVPQISENNCPASLSRKVITGLLRKSWGYNGLIITDAMEMAAITNFYTPGEAAVLAVEAGADIILISPSFENARDAIIKAVKSGRLSESRINDSVGRILTVKLENGIVNRIRKREDPTLVLGVKEHLNMANEIQEKNIQKQ